MVKRKEKESSCASIVKDMGCCKIESMITVDERGQMILPKDIRQRAGIRSGDKLALITMEKDNKICCMSFIKADNFTEMLKGILGPMFKEVIK